MKGCGGFGHRRARGSGGFGGRARAAARHSLAIRRSFKKKAAAVLGTAGPGAVGAAVTPSAVVSNASTRLSSEESRSSTDTRAVSAVCSTAMADSARVSLSNKNCTAGSGKKSTVAGGAEHRTWGQPAGSASTRRINARRTSGRHATGKAGSTAVRARAHQKRRRGAHAAGKAGSTAVRARARAQAPKAATGLAPATEATGWERQSGGHTSLRRAAPGRAP